MKLSDLGDRAQVMRDYGDALLMAVVNRHSDLFNLQAQDKSNHNEDSTTSSSDSKVEIAPKKRAIKYDDGGSNGVKPTI